MSLTTCVYLWQIRAAFINPVNVEVRHLSEIRSYDITKLLMTLNCKNQKFNLAWIFKIISVFFFHFLNLCYFHFIFKIGEGRRGRRFELFMIGCACTGNAWSNASVKRSLIRYSLPL